MNFEQKYLELIKTLKDADDGGLFDEKTSRLAHVHYSHRLAIRKILREHENTIDKAVN